MEGMSGEYGGRSSFPGLCQLLCRLFGSSWRIHVEQLFHSAAENNPADARNQEEAMGWAKWCLCVQSRVELKMTQGSCSNLENPVISCFRGCTSLDSRSGTEGKQILVWLQFYWVSCAGLLLHRIICWSHCHHLKVQIFPCRAARGFFTLPQWKMNLFSSWPA